jgi:hypothetical protein
VEGYPFLSACFLGFSKAATPAGDKPDREAPDQIANRSRSEFSESLATPWHDEEDLSTPHDRLSNSGKSPGANKTAYDKPPEPPAFRNATHSYSQ